MCMCVSSDGVWGTPFHIEESTLHNLCLNLQYVGIRQYKNFTSFEHSSRGQVPKTFFRVEQPKLFNLLDFAFLSTWICAYLEKQPSSSVASL